MNDPDQVWLLASGEPGALRFGHLVQTLRKQQETSVQSLASQAGLSVGTIRAIEQGRRAPSEESGVRLLEVLLPTGAVTKADISGNAPADATITFLDPVSESRVHLVFRAKRSGDNRRWSSDRPRAAESPAEALMSSWLNDPIKKAQFLDGIAQTLNALKSFEDSLQTDWEQATTAMQRVLGGIEAITHRAAHAASDEELGAVVRRLATLSARRVWQLEGLLELWGRVDSASASEHERELDHRLHDILPEYVQVPADEDSVPPRSLLVVRK